MTALTIILSVFTYLVIGKVFANVLVRFGVIDKQDEDINFAIGLVTIFYPLYILSKIVNFTGNVLTKIMFEKQNDNVQNKNNKY
jgi:hypothetical protein